ncbi:hypothetical protein ACFVAD_20565 [Sutcliffiella sp. NPDC057660]|uniref:hypothetical protein n=1 Tax=Sutcliffiella sp. NPDC057660 TaxID=3346199 RepID=UPI00369C5DC2
MIGRKILSALTTCLLMIILYSAYDGFGIGIFFGMYLLPIIFIYGIPSSILSDFVIKRIMGKIRMVAAFFIHIFLAILFVLMPLLLSGYKRGMWMSDVTGLLDVFLFISAIISAFLFWVIDELIKNETCKLKRRKFLNWIGDIKI